MIPPQIATAQAMANQNAFSSNKLTQQMQGMKLDGPPQNDQSAFETQLPYNQKLSPHHRPQIATTVTYSGQPRATYPYANNNSPAVSGQNTSMYSQHSSLSNSNFYSQSPLNNNVGHDLNNTGLNVHSPHPLGSNNIGNTNYMHPSPSHTASNGYDHGRASQNFASPQLKMNQDTPQQFSQSLSTQQLNQNLSQSPAQLSQGHPQLRQGLHQQLGQGPSPQQLRQGPPPPQLSQGPPPPQMSHGPPPPQLSHGPPPPQLSQGPPPPQLSQGPPPPQLSLGPPPPQLSQGPPPPQQSQGPSPQQNQGPPPQQSQGPPSQLSRGPPSQLGQGPPPHSGPGPSTQQRGQGPHQQFSQGPPPQHLGQGSPLQQLNKGPPSQHLNFNQPQQSNQSMFQHQQCPMPPVLQQPPPPTSTNMLAPQTSPGMQNYSAMPTNNQYSQQPSGYPDLSSPPATPGFPASQFSGIPPGSPGAGPNYQQGSMMSPGQPGYPMSTGQFLDQMPSTVEVREEDNRTRGGYYSTDVKDQPPPLVTTNFIAVDRGMCSPRFIRSSLYCIPNQPDMLKQTNLPFALTISPLAELVEGETETSTALYREEGPLRCKRCKAYMCPFMTFMEGGRCFQCAFCKVVTEVPENYFCFLDGMGERNDKYHRPELCLGSYEFVATKDYCRNDRLPNPPAYIFMLEVSSATFRNGLVPLLCDNLKMVLQEIKRHPTDDNSKLRVGFVTYSNVLHFYNLKKNLTHPHIMVLSDVHNAFVPLLDGFLVTLEEAEALVDCLMEHIPRLFMNESVTEVILGPVIQVGLEALKNAECSGKLFVFHASLPNADAPGKLQHREGQKLLGTDKQKTVLTPQTDFYNKLAQECVAAGCAVDLFLFPNAYVDVASLSPLCRHTGGQMFKYTYFQSHIDCERFLEDLVRDVTTTTAFDAVLRVRTSTGISPVFYYGNFYMSNTTDVELSAVDCHKAITIELAYDDKLPQGENVCIQAALLYTTCTGERRIRVNNLAIPTTLQMPDVYRGAEMDTIINFFSKQALKQILEQNPQQVKSSLVGRIAKILSCYKKSCAVSSTSGQLLLPDSLKLLPLFVNCMLKSDAISGGQELSLDDRSFSMLAVNSMDVKSTVLYFYPNLLPLHNIDPNNEDMPKPIRCSIDKLSNQGAYLLENGIYMFLWLGQELSPEWLQDVFGVPSTNQVDKQKSHLPELDNALSRRIRNLVDELQEDRQRYMRVTVMVQGDKLEVVFRQFLVEDRGTSDGSPSYVDFLCHLYKHITAIA